ncbi:MAG TPA: DNA polymerase III subunit gamma/tau [Candidatus Eisenbacteria bacterium]|nr:DNA polymerase III subunit gamma/tau [Candidatus Eisenbacteria bacterium]
MAHRALALKYRPQTFADLVGQEHVSTVLARAVESGRVAHAYLFTGARGVGKTTSARILAKALNCETRDSKGDKAAPEPCNTCTSCVEITSGVSLDVAEIDGASNRGIADVQALREKVRFSPTGGRHRVVIIDEVHQLSNDAFAALLKTLEEPPPHLVFIFATTDPQKLPDTIRSRTQRFDFARVPLRKVVGRLRDIVAREAKDPEGLHFDLTEGAALLIAQKSEGSMRDAVSALDQVVSAGEAKIDEELVRRVLGIADREAYFQLVESIVSHDPKGTLTALHQAFEKGIDPMELAQGLAEHLRHLLVLKVDPAAAELVPATTEELERLRSQASGWSEHDLLRLMKIAADLHFPMRDASQPMVHLEAAVMQMATLEPGETLAQLLQRLEALEKRLAGGGSARSAGGASPAEPSSVRAPAPTRSAPARTVAPGAASPSQSPPKAAAMVREIAAAATATAVIDDDAPRLDSEIEESWRTVVETINAQKRMLGAFLQESRLVGVTSRALLLAMDSLHRSVVDEQENRAMVERVMTDTFQKTLALSCVIETAPAERPRAADLKPLVDRAIAWFEGDLIQPSGDAGRNTP